MGNRIAKAREVKVTKSKFADDVSMYTSTRVILEQVAGELLGVLQNGASQEKTKLLTMGWQSKPEDSLPVQLTEGEISTVEDFTYLRSMSLDVMR